MRHLKEISHARVSDYFYDIRASILLVLIRRGLLEVVKQREVNSNNRWLTLSCLPLSSLHTGKHVELPGLVRKVSLNFPFLERG